MNGASVERLRPFFFCARALRNAACLLFEPIAKELGPGACGAARMRLAGARALGYNQPKLITMPYTKKRATMPTTRKAPTSRCET